MKRGEMSSVYVLFTLLAIFSRQFSTVFGSSCDATAAVCQTDDDSVSFPTPQTIDTQFTVDDEADFGGMKVYYNTFVEGFYKMLFPNGLPWSEFGAMMQTFMGNNGPDADPALEDKKGDPMYLLEESQTMAQEKYADYIGFVIIAVPGLLFILLFPLVCCCFCCCRCCCKKCGGKNVQPNPTKCCFITLLVMTAITMITVAVGASLLINTHIIMADHIPSKQIEFSNNVYSVLNDWLLNTVDEYIAVFIDRYIELKDIMDSDTIGRQIFRPIVTWLDMMVATDMTALESDISSYNTESTTFTAKTTSAVYKKSTDTQNMYEISQALRLIHTSLNGDATCTGDGGCSAVITEINKHIIDDAAFNTGYPTLTTATYSHPPITDGGFSNTLLMDDIETRADPEVTADVSIQKTAFITVLNAALTAAQATLVDTRASMADLTSSSGEIKELSDLDDLLKDYDAARMGASFAVGVPAIFVFVFTVIGVTCGLIGYSSTAEPYQRSNLSKRGGSCVCCGAVLSFLFVWFYIVGFIFPFLMLAPIQVICSEMESGEVLENIIDRPYFIDGTNKYFLGDVAVGDPNYELTISGAIEKCKNGEKTWKVFAVEDSTEYNIIGTLEDATINAIPDTNTLFDQAQNFDFAAFSLLDGTFASDITDIKDNSATYVTNLNTYYTALNDPAVAYETQLTTTQAATPTAVTGSPCAAASDCDSLDDIQTALSAVAVSSTAITNAISDLATAITNRDQMVTDIAAYQAAKTQMDTDLASMATNAAALETNLGTRETQLQTNGTAWMIANADLYAQKLDRWLNEFYNYVIDAYSNVVGQCETFSSMYDATIVYYCDYFFLEFNGAACAAGVIGAGLFLNMIGATKLSKYFKRMNKEEEKKKKEPRKMKTPPNKVEPLILPIVAPITEAAQEVDAAELFMRKPWEPDLDAWSAPGSA